MKAAWFSLLLLLPAALCAGEELDFSALRTLAVQKDGRKKPLDTVANEAALRITGSRRNAMEFLLTLWLRTRDWQTWPVVCLTHRDLKQQLGLAPEQKHFSYRQLTTPALDALVERASRKKAETRISTEREALAVAQRMQALAELAAPDALLVVPHPTDPKGAWEPIPNDGPLRLKLDAVRRAFVQRDSVALGAAARELEAALRAVGPKVYPSRKSLAREVHYNQFHPFRKAEYGYGISFLFLLLTWRLRSRAGYWAAVAVFGLGLLLHGYGFYLRTVISGRPPITNMYESVVWVSFGAAAFALLFEVTFRNRFCLAAVTPVAAVMLVLADLFPTVMDPGIGPLVPVLRSNFWLTVHVPAVTLGYSAFAVAMALGHVALAYHVFRPQATETLQRLEHFIYRAMQAGVLLLAAGTILGGIWAHYAWGRFWGWDPKETWALISLLSYVVPLHGRFVGWLRGFGLSVASVLCFLTVLMAWYGVNFILGKGLHAYGFGSGGTPYAIAFVLLELGIVVAAIYRKRPL